MELELYIRQKFSPFFGLTQNQLAEALFLNIKDNKGINNQLIKKLMQLIIDNEKKTEFRNENIVVKTVRLEKSGTVRESMSFPYFKYIDIVNQEWENSDLNIYFTKSKFMFVVFQKTENQTNNQYLKEIIFWKMSANDIEECKKVWSETKLRVQNSQVTTDNNYRAQIHFPAKIDSAIMHVRPHASNFNDVIPLPSGGIMVKHCFWLNNDYIEKVINGERNS